AALRRPVTSSRALGPGARTRWRDGRPPGGAGRRARVRGGRRLVRAAGPGGRSTACSGCGEGGGDPAPNGEPAADERVHRPLTRRARGRPPYRGRPRPLAAARGIDSYPLLTASWPLHPSIRTTVRIEAATC